MTEDAPLEPVAPEPVTDPVTEPVAPVTEPVPAAAAGGPGAAAGSWPVPGASGAPPRSSTVAVPKWLLLVVGAIVIAGIGFAVGYAVAPDGGGDSNAFRVPRGFAPGPFRNGTDGNGNGIGNGNGNGNGGGSGTRPANPSNPSNPSSPSTQGGGFLGVATTESSNPAGAEIQRVVAGTPAANGGLKVGDVITKVDDDAVTSPAELAERIGAHQPGDQVTITYMHDGATATTRVTLARSSIELPTPSTTRPQL